MVSPQKPSESQSINFKYTEIALEKGLSLHCWEYSVPKYVYPAQASAHASFVRSKSEEGKLFVPSRARGKSLSP